MHNVPGSAELIRERQAPGRQSVRMVEQENLCHGAAP